MRMLPLVKVLLTVAIVIASGPVHAQLPESSFVATEGRARGGDPAVSQYFGAAVALSGDTAIVGAPLDDVGGGPNQGTAQVFRRVQGGWELTARLLHPDGRMSDQFGASVAIDGDVAVVGAPFVDARKANEGAAYVFTRSSPGGVWTLSRTLRSNDGTTGANFGGAVAVYGNTVLVGAPNQSVDGRGRQGAAYVFDVVTGAQRKLTSDDGAVGDHFGHSVGLEGNIAVIGAPGKDVDGATDAGAVYVVDLATDVRTRVDADCRADCRQSFAQFGRSVSIRNGEMVVGAPFQDVVRLDEGAAYVFLVASEFGSVEFRRMLTAPFGGERFGWSVAISGNGILVGAYGTRDNRGSAYLFDLFGGPAVWRVSDGAAGSYTGWSVALSGTLLAVGAPLAQGGGAVEFFNVAVQDPDSIIKSLDLQTQSPTVRLNESVTLTATARDFEQRPVAGAAIVFRLDAETHVNCFTDRAGTCSITVDPPLFPAVAVVEACYASQCATVRSSTALHWVIPAHTAGASLGIGEIIALGSAEPEGIVAFGAGCNGPGCRGTCRFRDEARGLNVECLDVTSYVQGGSQASFWGRALVNDVEQSYRVDVSDGGRSRESIDTFRMTLQDGYVLAGAMGRGRVDVGPQP